MNAGPRQRLTATLLGWLALCSCAALLIVLLLLAGRGFDITDEGYYLWAVAVSCALAPSVSPSAASPASPPPADATI